MNSVYFYTLIIIMSARCIFQNIEKPVSFKKSIFILFVEVILVVPLWSSRIIFLLLFLVALNGVILWLENTKLNIHLSRFLSFTIFTVFLASITGNNLIIHNFSPIAIKLFQKLSENNLILNFVNNFGSEKIFIYLSGLLIITNEVNNFVRYILYLLRVEPNGSGDSSQQNEYVKQEKNEELKRGKIIGIIERILIFVFTLSNNFAAIGFILAAKGFTRFKELDNRNFAEYVLIGTLLSTSISILTGLLFSRLLLHI